MIATPHERIIERQRGWFQVEWRELWEYRDLGRLLIQRDLIARYKQTLLGPLWYIAQPVLTTAVFVIIFARIAGIPTDGVPAPLFYLAGMLGWNYFAQNLNTAGTTFVNNAGLFSKVWFPRLLMPLSSVLSNLVALGLQFLPFAAFLFYYLVFSPAELGAVHLGWHMLLIVLPILHVAVLSLGVSLWMAASTARFRDLVHLQQFLLQLWMFASLVFLPLSAVPKRWEWLAWANPMVVPVESFRWCLLGRGTLPPGMILLSLAVSGLLLITGIAAFERSARSAVDSL